MSQSKFMEGWERKKTYLTRSVSHELPDLSTIQEDDSSALSPSPSRTRSTYQPRSPRTPPNLYPQSVDRYSPLPSLIIEREPNKHDEPEEFYIQLERRIKKYYRKLFFDEDISISSAGDQLTKIDDLDLTTAEDYLKETDDRNSVNEVFDKSQSPEEIISEHHSLNEQEQTPDNLENLDMSLTLIDDEILDENITTTEETESTEPESQQITTIAQVHRAQDDRSLVRRQAYQTDEEGMRYEHRKDYMEDDNHIRESIINELDKNEHPENMEGDHAHMSGPIIGNTHEDNEQALNDDPEQSMEEEVPGSDKSDNDEDDDNLDRQRVSDDNHQEEDENTVDLDNMEEVPGCGDLDYMEEVPDCGNLGNMEKNRGSGDNNVDHVYLDRHGVSDDNHQLQDRNTVGLGNMEEVPGYGDLDNMEEVPGCGDLDNMEEVPDCGDLDNIEKVPDCGDLSHMEEVRGSGDNNVDRVYLDGHGVSENTHKAEDRNNRDLDNLEEVPGSRNNDEDQVYLDIHGVSDNTRHLEIIDVMRTPRPPSHGSQHAANISQTAENSSYFDPLLLINDHRHSLHLDSSQPFNLLRFSSSGNHDGNTSGRKRKTTSFADVSTSIKRLRGVDIETQTTADVGIQSTKDYMEFNRNILNDNLFVGTLKVFKLCPHSDHVCGDKYLTYL